MKKPNSIRLALITLSAALIVPVLSASDVPSNVGVPPHSSPASTAVRASERIGGDVVSSDGMVVGRIADYVLQFQALPQLRYVIVKSGGFLGLHADQRAIPADAITLADNRVRVNVTSADFGHLAVMASNRRSYLAYADNLTNMAKQCGTPLDHADLKADYVLFSELGFLSPVIDKRGKELGYFSDLWIDFNSNEAPYFQFDPANGPLDSFGNIEYDVPTTGITNVKDGQIRLAFDAAEFDNLKFADDAAAVAAAAGEKLEAAQTQPAQ